MDDQMVTVGGQTYRLRYTGTSYSGGQHGYRLQAPGDGHQLAWVVRTWRPGSAPDGTPVPVWGWQWGGAWYADAPALVTAVLAAHAGEVAA